MKKEKLLNLIARIYKIRNTRTLVTISLLVIIALFSYLTFFTPDTTSASWWPDGGNAWAKRKQLTLTNDSTDSLAANTTVAVSIDTKSLVNSGQLQDDCDDLRVLYQPDASTFTELDRYVEPAGGGTCATSEGTNVYFSLQAALASTASITDYFAYYGNSAAATSEFNLDSTDTTFTAGLAKRDPTNVFAGAPMFQGGWIEDDPADSVTFPKGNQVSGDFSESFDWDQGSISFWITPEWNGNDGQEHKLLTANDAVSVAKTTGDNLRCVSNASGGAGFQVTTADVSGWTVGTTYHVVCRWDTKNTLDGTNYLGISVNDAHTFGATTEPGLGNHATSSNVVLGATIGTPIDSVAATIEGLTIYRRPLFDGSNGIDVGNGDEIAAIYNSGSGADPTLTTGSWDVVFALPTDASPGALATGTGDAWSHPHSSNLLGGTNGVNGFLLDGTAWTSFTQENTPSANGTLTTADQIFAGGYYFTSDAVDEGYYRDITVTAGDDWVIRGIANSDDANCVPKLELYDQTNTATIGSLTGVNATGTHDGSNNVATLSDSGETWTADEWIGYTIYNTTDGSSATITDNDGTTITASLSGGTDDDWDTSDAYRIASNRAKPDVFIFTGEAPSGQTTLRVKLVNTASSGTCNWHQVEVQSNMITNPSLESGSGDPWIPTGLSNTGVLDSGDTESEATTVHSGSTSVQFNTGATTSEGIYDNNSNETEGAFYNIGGWVYGDGSAGFIFGVEDTNRGLLQSDNTRVKDTPHTANWSNVNGVWRGVNTGWKLRPVIEADSSASGSRFVDDFYAYLLDDVTLTVTPTTEANSTETAGIRVDGRDTFTQPVYGLTTTEGAVTFKYTPRHSEANALAFLEDTDVYIGEWYGDSDDYIQLYWSAANTITLAYSMNGTTGSSTWDATGAIVENTTYLLTIQYIGGDSMKLTVGSIDRITLSSIPAAFGTVPDTAYWGSRQNGDRQGDALFAAGDDTVSSIDSENSFDIGSKKAMLVCSFDGTTTCTNDVTPTTETGAIRYGGSKGAISFDGVGTERVSTAYDASLYSSTALTVEVWYKSDKASSAQSGPIVVKSNTAAGANYNLQRTWDSPHVARFVIDGTGGTAVTGTTDITDGVWHHIVGTWDGSTTRLYVDGTEEGTAATSQTMNADNSEGVGVGAYAGGANTIPGEIDEVRVSDVVRYSANFTAPTASHVRDEHTMLLYHLDEAGDDPRNTGKTIDDSGNGNHGTITGAKYVQGLVGVDASTTDTGNVDAQSYASHQGIFIEEGTTNKVTNPSFDHGTYNTNWSTSGGAATDTENTTAPYYKFGSKSYSSALSTATDRNIYTSINAGNTNDHTLSAYVYRGTSGSEGDTVDNTVAQLYWQGVAQATTTYTDMGGGWWRLAYDAAGTASAQDYGVTVVEDSGTLYIDGVQLEEFSYATTYADGTLSSDSGGVDTYYWDDDCDGTLDAGEDEVADQHVQCSSRNEANIRMATSGNLNTTAGTISMWVKPNWDGDDGVSHYFFNLPRTGGANDNRTQLYKYTNNSLVFVVRDGAGSSTQASIAVNSTNMPKDRWAHVVATWDDTDAVLYLNTTSDTASGTGINPTSFYANAEIGSYTNTGVESPQDHIGAVVSDLRTFDTNLTAAEVTDLYQAGLVSHSEDIVVDRFQDDSIGQNPIAIWHFDEGADNTCSSTEDSCDASTYGNHLTNNGPTWIKDAGNTSNGSYLQFDGTDDYASRTSDTDFNFGTDSFTLVGNFKHSSTAPTASTTNNILARYTTTGWKVYMDEDGYICFGIDDDATWAVQDSACSTATQGSYADSRWHHFEAVKNGTSSVTLYIDGVQVAQDASLLATGTMNDTATLYIGIDSDGTSDPWDGFLDEIFVYPYARSATQVQADVLGTNQVVSTFGKQGSNDTLTDGLVGHWKMDDSVSGDAQTITDSSGNGNDGTTDDPDASGMDCTVSGVFVGGCDVDGIDDVITTPDSVSLSPTSEVTVAGWIQADATFDDTAEYHQGVVDKGAYQFYLDKGDGEAKWALNEDAAEAFSALEASAFAGQVNALAAWNGNLYIGGQFSNAGGDLDADYIVMWDGSTLSWPSGQSTGGIVYALAVWNGNLIVGGSLLNAGGDDDADGLAIWNGSSFSWPAGQACGSTVRAIAPWNGDLYVAGTFSDAGGDADADRIAMWNGSAFSWPSGQTIDSTVMTMAVWNNNLYLGGYFQDAGGDLDADRIAMWNGSAFSWPTGQDLSSAVTAMASYNGTLHVGGGFLNAGGDGDADRVASWDGTSFSWPTNQGIGNGGVNAMVSLNGNLYMAGSFSSAGQDSDADAIALWDGSSFSWPTGEGFTGGGSVFALGVWNGRLYVGGDSLNGTEYMGDWGTSSPTVVQVSSQTSSWTANTWYHVAGTYDGANIRLYVDGEIESEVASNFTIEDTAAGLYIGSNHGSKDAGGSRELFDGSLDELRVYNRALSPSEVRQLYNWAPGPVVYYDFDENTGTGAGAVFDRSGTGNDGDMEASMTESDWTQGRFGGALAFDGTDDYVDADAAAAAFSITQGTVMTWVKATETDLDESYHNILMVGKSSPSDFIEFRQIDNTIWDFQYEKDTGNTISGPTVVANQWYHLAASWDASTLQFYVDGVFQGEDTSFTVQDSAWNEFIVGAAKIHTDRFSTAVIDEVKAYDYVRTPSQIIEDMNAGHPVGGSPIGSQVGYWKFDEGFGDTLYDHSPQGNDGDMAGSGTTCPQSGDSACPAWTNAGRFSKALYFDPSAATDDYVDIGNPSALQITDEFSLSAWIRPDSNQNNEIISKYSTAAADQSWTLGTDTGGSNSTLEFAVGNAACGASLNSGNTSELTNGEWYHVIAIFNPATAIQLYVNAELSVENTTSIPASMCDSTTNINIGRRSDDLQYFDGAVDEMKIYNTALTPEQILIDYNHGQSAVMGATGTDSSGNADWSAAREYCVPGDASTCNAPVSHWKFDEGIDNTCDATDDVCDTSGNDNHGLQTGTPVWKSASHCHSGKCLEFNGSSNDITVSDPGAGSVLDISSSGTITSWVYLNADTANTKSIIVKGAYNYFVDVEPDETVDFAFNTTNITSSTSALNTGQWYYIAGVFDDTANTQTIYINGSVDSTETGVTQTPTVNDSAIAIGSYQGGSEWFPGLIDDIRVYDYARTPAQVAWDYNRGAPVAHYTFNECSGSTAYDYSINANGDAGGNDGTITIGATGTNTSLGTCSSGTGTEAWNNGTTGKYAGSLDFDGTDDYVTVASPGLPTEDFTYSMWANLGTNTDETILMVSEGSGENELLIHVSNDSLSGIYLNNAEVIDVSQSFATNSWQHIAVTRDGNSVVYYLNGQQTGTGTDGVALSFSTCSLIIGADNDTSGCTDSLDNYFNGQIDDVRIYNYALTPEQVKIGFNKGAVQFGQ